MKKIKMLLVTIALSASMCFPVLAGAWEQPVEGQWKYLKDNKAYAMSEWVIDSEKNYYFDATGLMLFNTVTPDGYYVGLDGAWNGQAAQALPKDSSIPATALVPATKTGISTSPYDGYTIVANTSSKKYHLLSCSYVSDISADNLGYCSDSSYLNSQGYAACKKCH